MNDDSRDGTETEDTPQGLYIANSMTGGAVALGEGSRAEDRSRRVGSPDPAEAAPPASRVASAPPGQIVIGGDLGGGAIAAARKAVAVDSSVRISGSGIRVLDDLGRVRELLAELDRTFEVEAVDRELEAAEEEITREGGLRPGMLRRLLSLLRGGSTVLSGLSDSAGVLDSLRAGLGLLEARQDDS
ncbi:hypothetical protein [Nocardiopsis algeriensis]|uniref:Uncharacterized protein n=1 Tax=Nocardiopsis algeriensis TaxID=1478215 RepID=A0A841IRL6_9ACTN|nr:hypothetical protein [Nocardiopsis algeriensis]MBB6121323.1 hypothetical protein [Nocardiopsis algeriensis]